MLLQGLAELGLPGLLLALALFAGVAWGATRRRAGARASRLERGLLVASVGTFSAWAVHTQVDWMHLLPGITAGALLAGGVLVRPRLHGLTIELPRATSPVRRGAIAAVVVLPLAVAGVSLSRQVLAEHHRREAQAALADSRPLAAVQEANRALRLDRDDLETYYAKAAALARLGQAAPAKAVLREAVAREPGDFLTYALLGDVSVRQRRFRAAAGYYRQALARNPREPALQGLAKDPRAALR